MEIESALEPFISYLKERVATQAAVHRRKLDDLNQTFANRGIPISQEQVFVSFMNQCRIFLEEEANFCWTTIQAALSNPYPSLFSETRSKIFVVLDDVIPSESTIVDYFDGFVNRADSSEAMQTASRLKKQVRTERLLQIKIKQIEASKFVDVMERSELLRQHATPTLYDRWLRGVKNRSILLVIYLFILVFGLLGGLSTWVCGKEYPLQCFSAFLKAKSTTHLVSPPPLAPTANPDVAVAPTPSPSPTIIAVTPTSAPPTVKSLRIKPQSRLQQPNH